MLTAMKWQDRMRSERDTQKISSAELARRAGLNAASIRKYAEGKGNQPRGDVLQRIATALDVELLWLRDGIPPKRATPPEGSALEPDTIMTHTPPTTAGFKERSAFGGPRDVPVYKTLQPDDTADAVMSSEISDLAERPPGITGAVGVYAIFVHGDSMAPRYEHGEVVYIHPDRPIRDGSYVLAGYGDNRILLRRLISRSDTVVVLQRLNPLRDERHAPESLTFMHHILSLNELVGF